MVGQSSNMVHFLIKFHSLHSAYDPLQYPLLFPQAQQGWHPRMQNQRGGNISQREFYAYHSFSRPSNFHNNPLDLGGPLVDQYYVDVYAQIENNRLRFQRENQAKLRLAPRRNVGHAIRAQNGAERLGKKFLTSSFVGSPKYYFEHYLDAMAAVNKFGRPDIFLTMTANLNWPEIVDNLKPGQSAKHAPMLVNRVFKGKLDALIKHLYSKSTFGKMLSHVYTIEFQARGTPHAHVIIFLDNNSKMTKKHAGELDKFVSAEIPDPVEFPELHKLVTTHMVHKPCDQVSAPCIRDDGICKAHYPKPFRDSTTVDAQGYVQYRRRRGRTVTKIYNGQQVEVTNEYIVPYTAELLLLFDCHINVEIVSSVAPVKYLFKYIHKGPPKMCLSVGNDEFQNFVSGRYISPGDASWRILGFPLIDRRFTCVRLPVHLPEMQSVVFEDDDANLSIVYTRSAQTQLTQFFQFCKQHPKMKIKYPEMPTYAVWNRTTKIWTPAKNCTAQKLGRVHRVKPQEGERFYLRVLLDHVESPKSFKNLKTFRNVVYATFREAADARGLLNNDAEMRAMLDEASSCEMPQALRSTFASMLMFSTPTTSQELFNRYVPQMGEDFKRINPAIDAESLKSMVAQALDTILAYHGSSLFDYIDVIPLLHPPSTSNTQESSLYQTSLLNVLKFTPTQTAIYETLQEAIRNRHDVDSSCFMLNAPAGTGKTFLLNGLVANCIHNQLNVAATATSAIAASLLINGNTAHSKFNLPVEYFDSATTCNVMLRTSKAKELESLDIIIIDEITMLHRYLIEAIDRTLQDIMGNCKLFGGKVVIFSGDFQQTLPVIPRATRPQIVTASLKSSPLYPHVMQLYMTENLRCNDSTFNTFVSTVGQGTHTGTQIQFPPWLQTTNTASALFNAVYPNLIEQNDYFEYFQNKMVLATTNKIVREINAEMTENFPGDATLYESLDSPDRYARHGPPTTTTFLNEEWPTGFPPHSLYIKKYANYHTTKHRQISR